MVNDISSVEAIGEDEYLGENDGEYYDETDKELGGADIPNESITPFTNNGLLSHNKSDESSQESNTERKELFEGAIQLKKEEVTAGEELIADVSLTTCYEEKTLQDTQFIQEKSKKIQIVLVNSKDENDINVVEKTIKQTADNEENSQDDLSEYTTFSNIVDIDTGT